MVKIDKEGFEYMANEPENRNEQNEQQGAPAAKPKKKNPIRNSPKFVAGPASATIAGA